MRAIVKTVAGAVLAFLIIGIACSVIICTYKHISFLEASKQGFSGSIAGIDMLFALLIGLIIQYGELHKQHEKGWERLIKTRDLVLHPEINYFESKHLGKSQEIMFSPDGGPRKCILALDSTSPGEWWANNMLGYLALQARWAMKEPNRTVSRFFVWSTCQFDSAAGMKIVQLHRLFGFETYIISQHCWDRIAKRNSHKSAKTLNHECFVWDDDDALPCDIHEMAKETFGYRSDWALKVGDEARNQIMEHLKIKEKKEVFFHPLNKEEAKAFRDLLNGLKQDEEVTKIDGLNVDDMRVEIMKHVNKYGE